MLTINVLHRATNDGQARIKSLTLGRHSLIRILFYILLIIGISETALSQKVLNYSFFDTSEKQMYHSISLNKDLKRYCGIRDSNATIILLKTSSLTDKDFVYQFKTLDSLESEQLGLLIVVSCVSNKYKDGYHTNIETAKEIEKQINGYKLIILNSKSMVIYQSKNVLSKKRLENILSRK
ncbi:MAG: hypothetical protein WAV76_02000 [Bacteroidota bacterium]